MICTFTNIRYIFHEKLILCCGEKLSRLLRATTSRWIHRKVNPVAEHILCGTDVFLLSLVHIPLAVQSWACWLMQCLHPSNGPIVVHASKGCGEHLTLRECESVGGCMQATVICHIVLLIIIAISPPWRVCVQNPILTLCVQLLKATRDT